MSNMQKNDKFLKKERKIYLEAWLMIVIYLAIALPIHFCVPAFSWHWFAFGLVFLIIPLGLVCAKTFFINKMNLTVEQQKKLNQTFGVGMLKLWLADFVYMTAFNHWLVPTYILGIIFIIIVFNTLVNAFLGKRNHNSFLNFCLAADLIIGIALTIYLIYIIPENTGNLQNIITTIVAATYGGLLTLAGVAWTIKHSDKQKRDDELAKAKPLFTFNLICDKNISAHKQKICLIDDNETPEILAEVKLPKGTESYIEFENSANSIFTIKRVYFDNKWHKVSANNVVLPNNKILVQLYRKNIIEHPVMEIEDIYSRKFYYDLKFICLPPLQPVQFCTLGELKEVTIQELQAKNIAIE